MIAADAMDRLADELLRVALSEDAVVSFAFMSQYHGLPAAQRAQQVARDDREARWYGRVDPATVHLPLELVTLLEGACPFPSVNGWPWRCSERMSAIACTG
jgi:hypothetical protein